MWEGGKCVPPPPRVEKKIWPSFGYEVGPRGRRLLRSETEVGFRWRRWLIFMADDLLERAARRCPRTLCPTVKFYPPVGPVSKCQILADPGAPTIGLSSGQGPPLDLTSLTFTALITYKKLFHPFNSNRYITYVLIM